MTHVDDLMVAASEDEHKRFEDLLKKIQLEYTKSDDDILRFQVLIIEQSHETKTSRNGHQYVQS